METLVQPPSRSALLLAERLGLLARHGQFDEAAACLPAARRVVECEGDGEAKAKLSLSQAILAHCSGNTGDAIALAELAVADARLNGQRALVAECEAWSAQVHAAAGAGIDRAIEHIDDAVSQAGIHAPSAMARALYVLAALCQQSDLETDSARGYRWARAYASDAGDLLLVQTIAGHHKHVRTHHARWRLARGRLDDALRAAAMHHDREPRGGDTAAFGRCSAAWERRHCPEVSIAGGAAGDAPHPVRCHLPFPEATGAGGSAAMARSDRALGHARHGEHEKALSEADAASSLLDLRADAYTASVVLGNLAEVAARLGCTRAAESLDARSLQLWQQHQGLWQITRQRLLGSGVLRHLSP